MHKNDKRVATNAYLTVRNITKLSNNLIRITFDSDKVLDVNPLWIGPHLKLLFADPNSNEIAFPTRDENNKISWQEGVRERVRTYSIRSYDVTSKQLTIDFVNHATGVASVWARQAQIGQQVGLIGMGAKREFDHHDLVLIGDISAMPAICYTLEQLPNNQKAVTFIEVNDATDIIACENNNQTEIIWLIKDKNNLTQLIEHVLQYQLVNVDEVIFWGGMESSLAQQMRHAIKEKYTDLSSDSLQIISYWREGFAEGEFRHRD